MSGLERIVNLLKDWQHRVDAYRIKKLQREIFELKKKLYDQDNQTGIPS